MKKTNNIIAIAVWVAGLFVLCYEATPILGGLFFVPFTLGPHAITHMGVWAAKTTKAQVILTLTLIAYAIWFSVVYVDVRYLHPDPQSPIALLFVGIYALPGLLPLWAIAWWFDRKAWANK
jgi:hypothetical protein